MDECDYSFWLPIPSVLLCTNIPQNLYPAQWLFIIVAVVNFFPRFSSLSITRWLQPVVGSPILSEVRLVNADKFYFPGATRLYCHCHGLFLFLLLSLLLWFTAVVVVFIIVIFWMIMTTCFYRQFHQEYFAATYSGIIFPAQWWANY